MLGLRVLSRVCLIFFAYILISYFYIGILSVPTEGDSLNYHIPVAKSYLDGTIFTPEKIQGVPFLKYSPGASEGILALFYLLHIPANLFNVLGVIVFFLSSYLLGIHAGLRKELAIIFATSIVTINGVVRWLDTQKIDIFLASFYALSLALLLKPQKTVKYFFALGFVLGMLVGSKYSGLFFGCVLLIVFVSRLYRYLSYKNLLAFLVPFFTVGISWYIRNWIVTGNPLYPQGFLFFEDDGFPILSYQVWKVVVGSWSGAVGTFNAFISEYMIWVFAFPILAFFGLKNFNKFSKNGNKIIYTFLIIGLLNLIIYAFLPSDNHQHIMVSVVRYSYPALITFLVGTFIIAQKYKWDERIGFVSLANMFFVGFPITYSPKLVFILVPIALLLISRNSKKNKGRK